MILLSFHLAHPPPPPLLSIPQIRPSAKFLYTALHCPLTWEYTWTATGNTLSPHLGIHLDSNRATFWQFFLVGQKTRHEPEGITSSTNEHSWSGSSWETQGGGMATCRTGRKFTVPSPSMVTRCSCLSSFTYSTSSTYIHTYMCT